MSRGTALLKSTALISAAKLAVQASAFLLLPLYTRYLSQGDYGLVELVLVYMGLFSPILLLQTDSAIFRILLDKRSNINNTHNTISSIWAFGLGALTVAILTSFGVAWIFKNHVLAIAGLVIASYMFLSLAQQTARGIGEINAFVLSSVTSGFAVIGGNVFALLVLEAGALGVMTATAIGYSVGALMALGLIRFWRLFSFRRAKWEEVKEALRYSLPLVPNGVSWWLIDAGGRAVLALFQGLEAVGVYGVASRFAMIFSQAFGYFNLAWVESASLSINDADRNAYYSTVFNRCIQVCCSIVLLLLAGIPFYFPLLVSSSFIEAKSLIPILLLGALFNAWVTLYSSIYVALKNTRSILITTVLAAALSLLLSLTLVNSLGSYAIACASLTSWIVVLILRHFSLSSVMHILYTPRTWIVMIATVLSASSATFLMLADVTWPSLPVIAFTLVFIFAANSPLIRTLFRSRVNDC